jgi:hypothetical protein
VKLRYLRKRLIKPYYKWVYVLIEEGNKIIKVRKRVRIKANWRIMEVKHDRRKKKARKIE